MTETQRTPAMKFDTDDFEADVIERSHSVPVLVDFWADWCGPCKILGPTLEKLARAANGEWVLAKVDTEKHREVSAQYGIRNIPNVKLFIDGQVATEFVGALPEPAVVDWLRKAIPSRYAAQVESAARLLRESRPEDARELLEEVITVEPGNARAAVLLAETHLAAEPARAAALVESVGPGSEGYETAEAIRTLADLYVRLVTGDALSDDPVKEIYSGAIEHARSGDYAASLDGFIEVIRKNRGYDDDGARKACIAIFKLLGEDDPITRGHRAPFGNALY